MEAVGIRQSAPVLDRIYDMGIEGLKTISKLSSMHDKIIKLAANFSTLPEPFFEISVAFRSLKIIAGVRAVPKLCTQILKVARPGALGDRLLAGWGAICSIKKVEGAVEGIFFYLNKLQLIDKAALGWTTIAGYVFLPVSIISTAIMGFQFSNQSRYLVTLTTELKTIKQSQTANKTERLCLYLLDQKSQLKSYKVISQECPLEERLKKILQKQDEQSRADLRTIRRSIKGRLREQVGIAGVKTSLSTAGSVATVVGLACPPAAMPLAIAAVVMGLFGLATFIYSRVVPKGDFVDNEKQLLFTKMHHGAKQLTNLYRTIIPVKV